MRARLAWAAALVALVPLTCGPRTHFDVQQTGQASVTGSPTTLAFSGFEPFSVTKNQAITSQGLSPSQYQSVMVNNFLLRAVNGGDLSFIKSISFTMNAPGEPALVIATAKTPVAGTVELPMDVVSADLVKYFKASSMSITAQITVTAPAQTVVLEADPTFTFTVNELPAACLKP